MRHLVVVAPGLAGIVIAVAALALGLRPGGNPAAVWLGLAALLLSGGGVALGAIGLVVDRRRRGGSRP